METEDQQYFSENYNPFGTLQGSLPFIQQTQLPSGMIPNYNEPVAAANLQTGSQLTSEINQTNGVLFSGITDFPQNVSQALAIDENGYRLGLDKKGGNLTKLFIGSKTNFLFWDGIELIINGQLQVYGKQNSITFYDTNLHQQGELYADDTGIVFQSNNEMVIGAGGNMTLTSGNVIQMIAGSVQMLFLDPTLIQPAIQAFVPFGLAQLAADPATGINGQLYYNTTTDNVMAFVAGAWVIVV